MTVTVRRATSDDLPLVAPLFDGYRVFYHQRSNLDAAREFLTARLELDQSVIFLAQQDDTPVGFTQLYPMFSSVRVCREWILNDLFVSRDARGAGVGRALMKHAITFARDDGAARISLSTARDNTAARALYDDLGFQTDDVFLDYSLRLD